MPSFHNILNIPLQCGRRERQVINGYCIMLGDTTGLYRERLLWVRVQEGFRTTY